MKLKRACFILSAGLLAVSLALNVWLTLKVMDYKGRCLLAKEFPDQTPLQVEKDGRMLLWLSGDSRIASWSFPESPQRKVVNRGVGGFTARETLDRFRADLAAGSRPDVVVIQAGINDVLSAGYNRPSRLTPASAPRPAPGRIMAQCLENLQKLVKLARESGSRVILLTVFPPGPYSLRDRFFWTSELETHIRDLNTALRRLAGTGVTVLDSAALLAPGGRTEAKYCMDCLHLNDAGYKVLSDALDALLSAPAE